MADTFAVIKEACFPAPGSTPRPGRTPSVRVTFNRPPRGTEFADFLVVLASYYDRKVRYQMFFEPKNIGVSVLMHVPTLVRYMREYEEQHRAYLVRTAVYTRSDAIRGFINAAFKLKAPVSEIRVFGDRDAAYEYMGWGEKVRAARARRAT
jgi:hypothetical protein